MSIIDQLIISETEFTPFLNHHNHLEAVAEEIKKFDFNKTPLGRLLEVILAGAFAANASDIHWEPEAAAIKLRFRIDGLLYDIPTTLAVAVYQQLLNRLKLLARLKLNVREKPQDGRFSVSLINRAVEVRVSLVPAEFGETVVLRLLDPQTIALQLSELGLRTDDLAIVTNQLQEPNGMILATGPTGCGKTTTLYAFLRAKQTSAIKIVTIEDPIEYHLPGVEQTQADPVGGYDFSGGLRALVRQDPDVILVGEIRDQETAEIALQAALTGHLVFSTIHSNNAAGAIPRLLDLNVKQSTIGPALNLVLAQRLVRRLCSSCKKAATLAPETVAHLELVLAHLPDRVDRGPYLQWQTFLPGQCSQCSGFGYRGRVGIFELFLVDAAAEEVVNRLAGEATLEMFARERGMVTMQQDGLLKVITGTTTVEEVVAVTGPLRL